MLALKLALKNIMSASGERSVALMIKICFFVLALSSFGLALIVSIANGFQHETSKKLQSVHADITITAPTGTLESDKLTKFIDQKFPAVSAASPRAYQSLLIYRTDTQALSSLCACIGVSPHAEATLNTLTPYLCSTSQPLSEQVHGNAILMGKTLAATLNVAPGDAVTLLYVPHEITHKKVTFDEGTASIGGIFSTGIDELDNAVVYMSLDFFNRLFPETGITELALRCDPGTPLDSLARMLADELPGLSVHTWKDLYPALVAALLLEKYAAFIILSLVVMIAAINMIALIFMYIVQKKQDIVILKTLGMSESQIQQIFIILGLLIAVPATLLGLAGAALTSWLLRTYPLISLPDIYYVDHVPAYFDLPLALSVFCTVIFFSVIAAYIPTRRIRQFSIAHILKFGVE